MNLGVVADDLTGATDAGSMSAKAGFPTNVYSFIGFRDAGGSAVCVLDTDSRLDDPSSAYRKVASATDSLVAAGCERFHNKTCSVFRGNIGAEFDAMLDVLREDFAVVVLGFPKNGRTTVDGVHYVNGVRLEDTAFRNDPVHRMTRSQLVDILADQTKRSVSLVGHAVVARGEAALADAMAAGRERGGYQIIDVPDQAALATIARAVQHAAVRVTCGSSALIEELALTWQAPDAGGLGPGGGSLEPSGSLASSGVLEPSGVLLIAGSLTPQTRQQVERLKLAGIVTLTLDTQALLASATGPDAAAALARAATDVLAGGVSVLVQADDRPTAVAATQAAGAKRGLDAAATARLVSGALAQVAQECRDLVGLSRLVVAGGDTSAAVCRRLGVDALRVMHDVAPGVPVCRTLAGPPLLAVFKSGSFGRPEFLLDAVASLQEVHAWTA